MDKQDISRELIQRHKPLPKLSLRGGFSDRNGIKKENTTMQVKKIDKNTRTRLCNLVGIYFFNLDYYNEVKQILMKRMINDVFCEQIDHFMAYNQNWFFEEKIKKYIMLGEYDDVLTLIEYFCRNLSKDLETIDGVYCCFKDSINSLFEREYVGYRVIGNHVVQITNKQEQEAIEQALNDNPFKNSQKLLNEALDNISDREKPKYDVSIAKSIGAVESICQSLVGKQDSLGVALKKLSKKGVKIDPALESAFCIIFGWTSDNGNIRHANAFRDTPPTFDDAKFMLVSCSAFINYLISKSKNLQLKNTEGKNG